ncbi:Glucosamine-6-phosphate deaminase [Granulicella sibirica]|uniref:Glucosamine-6-phosphate deaminase n=2 Tax=Granulicella sibirica TaxID=2479048 RepID=A0A4V1L633_9BACT|nr:Glucosamine-6-phosphate deaminase [Granulicella sibirica]
MRARLSSQAKVRMIFAAAPSQSEMLAALVAAPEIEWGRVTAFHMDEYLGLAEYAPQRFGLWLRRNLFDRVTLGEVNLLEPGDDPEAAAEGYAAKLGEAPIDIVCCGIGTNGHLAFNDPPADLNDPKAVKVVALDAACRQQQVDDKCFAAFDEVPTHALTLTVPRLMAAESIFCCVPGPLKREAVRRTLEGPINGTCPASALRMHPHWNLYLDIESASWLSRVGSAR